MHIIQKSNILNIKKKNFLEALRQRRGTGYSGWNASLLWAVFLPEGCHRRGCGRTKTNKRKTYLTVCKQEDAAGRPGRSKGLCPLGLRGSREANLLSTWVPAARQKAVRGCPRVLGAGMALPVVPLQPPQHRDEERRQPPQADLEGAEDVPPNSKEKPALKSAQKALKKKIPQHRQPTTVPDGQQPSAPLRPAASSRGERGRGVPEPGLLQSRRVPKGSETRPLCEERGLPDLPSHTGPSPPLRLDRCSPGAPPRPRATPGTLCSGSVRHPEVRSPCVVREILL